MGNAGARTRLPFLAALLILACQAEDDSPPAAAGGDDPAATATSGTATGQASAADACALLPPGEVEPIVGRPVSDSLALAMPSDGPITLSQCNYAAGDNAALVSLLLRRGTEGQTAQSASESVRESLVTSGMELQEVPGLGGAALWGSNQLHVFGDAGWYIIVTPDAAAGLEQARALAERAVSRLEAEG